MRSLVSLRIVCASFGLVALSACGGGGGSSADVGPPATPITTTDYQLPKAIATVPDQANN